MHCLAQLNVPIPCDLYNRDGEIHRPSRPCRPFGNPDDCIFHFYLSVDDLNPSGGALFEIQNVVSTRIKYIPNTCEKQPMQCINFSVIWCDLIEQNKKVSI